MPLEGMQLGRFRLLHLLGSGGMGEVYLAEDARISRQVAIKVIRIEPGSYSNPEAIKEATHLFQREMKAIARLDHPNILPLFEYGEEEINGVPVSYMVMPYRPEGSFAGFLRQRDISTLLSAQDVAYVVSQASDALQHAHDRQIIHQDVKPANFLLHGGSSASRPSLLLADFGVAKFTTATASMSQNARGTPTYMAPEQWNGHPVPATDQYALAIMAYELLTGRTPFTGNVGAIMYQHLMTQPESPSAHNPRLAPAIDAVILRALSKKPEERFPSIAAFAQAFQQAVQSSGTLPVPAAGNNAPTVVPTLENTRLAIPATMEATVQAGSPALPAAEKTEKSPEQVATTNPASRASASNPFINIDAGKLAVAPERRSSLIYKYRYLVIAIVGLLILAGGGISIYAGIRTQNSPSTPATFSVNPTGFHASSDCNISSTTLWRCQVTLSLGQGSSQDGHWTAYRIWPLGSPEPAVSFDPSSGTLSPGQSIQVVININFDTNPCSDGDFYFVGSANAGTASVSFACS